MINAVIFDMDGLLIDSEPLWRRAQIAVFGDLGIALSEEMCLQTMGLRVDQVVQYWAEKYPGKIQDRELVRDDIVKNVRELVRKEGVEMRGVKSILEFLKQKKVRMAIASSSDVVLIDTVVDKLGIRDYFELIHSAEFEEYGKPHPGVYIHTAKKLKVPPENCLAFEDSLNGLLAAKSARMRCVSIPDKDIAKDARLALADVVLDSLDDFRDAVWTSLNR
jgi:mannitol-1-/sugar-/sorbitol-6-/2-deoxyglucose-6-phosphatase